jgi:predicted DNA-binding antitoxin AbrB/MazE fold protein
MTRISAVVQGGVFVPREPIDWPDGTEVEVLSVEHDDEQPDSPEEIARWLAEFHSIPPMEMTAEEEAAWDAARKAHRDVAAAGAAARIEAIRKSLE